MNEVRATPAVPKDDAISDLPHMLTEASGDRAMLVIGQSGLFDAQWYCACQIDVAENALDPLEHFTHTGWREGRRPNEYFDLTYYLAENPAVAATDINPLLHYILSGEDAGCAPCAYFDLTWYAQHYAVPPGASPLAHFLAQRMTGQVSPIAEFDPAFYLANYPDVAAARIDPFWHYLHSGYREGRNPSASFDTKFYLHRHLSGALDQNPLMHWRQSRQSQHAVALSTKPSPDDTSVFEHARRFSRPGAAFETIQKLPITALRHAKVLAYYLPQFHAIAENDRWWGNGFTEWTAIARGMPRFEGHYQPRIPRDLGHYDLSDPNVLRRQIHLARDAGIFGFVHYFYWFNGRRLLERPLEAMLADATLDFPFCLMWANENWTRRWDGSEQDVLISQDYRPDDDHALLACFARYFADPRYIRIQNRPVLMVYRAGLIPQAAATIARWRQMFRDLHQINPLLVMAQSFDDCDPTTLGFDGAIEFPPHKLSKAIPLRNQAARLFDPSLSGQIFDYDDVAEAALAEPPPPFPLIKTILPGWDNDARREGRGMVLRGATPAKYQSWLSALVDRSATHPFHGERLVCINAWNEWAEGAYLEPDVHFGAAFLNATGRAICRLPQPETQETIALIGHDAFAAGAQMLLLRIGQHLKRSHGVAVQFLLLDGGDLLAQYAAIAAVAVADDQKKLRAEIAALQGRGVTRALVNTSVAARIIPLLQNVGIEVVVLVHEMPQLMEERGLIADARAGVALARRVIFPADAVLRVYPARNALTAQQTRILPQALYRPMRFDPQARARLRADLGLADNAILVIGAGYGDLRKGLDVFLHTARTALRLSSATIHFAWIGALCPNISRVLSAELAAAQATGRVHMPGFSNDMLGWMNAADAFALTSREDPYPSVGLEAMACGLPLVAFAGSGGMADRMDERTGTLVPMADFEAMAHALLQLATQQNPHIRAERAAHAAQADNFAHYTASLLAELRYELPRVSVAVLSYNYAHHLPERLGSLFAQTAAVEEIIVLDDASTDDSAAQAQAIAADWGRDITLDIQPLNGGNVFAQWRRATALARGTHLWIAEADDSAEPDMLARLSRLIAAYPDLDFAFCDSRAVNEAGETVMASYKPYCSTEAGGMLLQDGVFSAQEFLECLSLRNTILNVSAVVFRTEALRAALARCGEELTSWRVAGDWRVYLDILTHSTGRIGYLASPLNIHRRHAQSVTARLSAKATLAEIRRMHRLINQSLPADPQRLARQKAYRDSVQAEPSV